MNFSGLFLPTLLVLGVFSISDDRMALRPRLALEHENQVYGIKHERRQSGIMTQIQSLSKLMGGDIGLKDLAGLAQEFLSSPINAATPPKTSKVGKTKALEILTRLDAQDKPGAGPIVLTAKSAQMFTTILQKIESGAITGGKTAKRVRRLSLRATTTPAPGAGKAASPAAGDKTVKALLKKFCDGLPEPAGASGPAPK